MNCCTTNTGHRGNWAEAQPGEDLQEMAPAMRELVADYMDEFFATIGDQQAVQPATSSARQIWFYTSHPYRSF